MSEIEAEGPNAAQIEYWNDETGRKWVDLQELLDQQLETLGIEAMAHAGIAEGDRVLDVGCGCGHTTREIARRVGPKGGVLGVDISSPMLEMGRNASSAEGLANADFLNSDAQTHGFEAGSFDRLFSRFGVMFFAEPAVAFANMRAALRPDGTMGFVCWQALDRNAWMAVPVMAAMQHITIERPASPHAPGPFALADAERLAGILDEAGFTDVEMTDYRTKLTIGGGGTVEEAVDFLTQMGPVGQMLRKNQVPEEKLAALIADVGDALAPYHGEDGVRMDAAAWMVSGRSA